MRYMFLIYSKETERPLPETMEQVAQGHRALMEEATRKGVLEAADPLKPTSMATTVRCGADDRILVTDGPFAETKEQLAGYYIITCRDLDEAIEWASKIPSGCKGEEGCIEIRPIHEIYRPAVIKSQEWTRESA